MESKKPKLLVTGGTGYLCSNLLNDKAFREIFAEIQSLGRTPKEERIDDKTAFNFKKFDLTARDVDWKFIREADVLLHSAHLRNIDADKLFLENFKKKKVIFFSSSAVYGEVEKNKKAQVDDECNPISDYGFYKLEMEEFIREKIPNHLILRISNPYGGRNPGRNIYQIFSESLTKGQTININSEKPKQMIRDFLPMADFIKQVRELVSEGKQGTFNISSGTGITLEEMLEKLAKEHGKKLSELDINYKGFKEGDIQCSVLEPKQ